MKSELYTAAQGLIARQAQLDNISHNIANASTNGFREVSPFFQSYNRALESGPANPLNNAANNQPVISGVFYHSKQGALKETGSPLDVAIDGTGFFKLNTPFGQRYTRNGHFSIDAQGTLKTTGGYEVLDTNDRPIVLDRNMSNLYINSEGEVSQNGKSVGRIKMVTFADNNQLTPEEDNLMVNQNPNAPEQAATSRLVNGTLETSNVNMAKQMIDMITAHRAYDINVRTIRTIDSTMTEGVMRGFGPR